MFETNIENKLPLSLKWYALVKIALLFFIFSLIFIVFGKSIWLYAFFFLFIFLGLPLWIYLIFTLKFTSFVITENTITINSGIFFKNSKTISFDKIQNCNASEGILSKMFNLSKLNIWTASPSQIHIERGNSSNKPEQFLWLNVKNAHWLKNFIFRRQ
ncbi:MAG: PH domain-containing protein [Candidatus Pacebacteria bacterium]|nr:PH domain-containing protein [Candidatus Paceibacterota bacterium]